MVRVKLSRHDVNGLGLFERDDSVGDGLLNLDLYVGHHAVEVRAERVRLIVGEALLHDRVLEPRASTLDAVVHVLLELGGGHRESPARAAAPGMW